jgi:hypothetical protein
MIRLPNYRTIVVIVILLVVILMLVRDIKNVSVGRIIHWPGYGAKA